MRRIICTLLLCIAPLTSSQAQEVGPDWIESAEAYFATAEERREWSTMESAGERTAFVKRYWERRDPTPETDRNEFREAILGRIKKANEKFPIEETAGARTARGFVWVVFGPPARFRVTNAPPPTPPRLPVLGRPYEPQYIDEAGESNEVWTYDRERTPRLLEMVGLPSLSFTFVIRPQRKSDELQTPGLAYELRDKLARRSIVNLVAAAPAARAEIDVAKADATLSDHVREALDAAPPAASGLAGARFGHAVAWSESGKPFVVVWLFMPGTDTPMPAGSRLYGRIIDASQKPVATIAERFRETTALTSFVAGRVYATRLDLPVGNHQAAFAAIAHGGQVLTSRSMPIHVADAAAFSSSSLFLTDPPAKPRGSLFEIGNVALSPRADATFSRGESLWFFSELRNVAHPEKVTIEIRVRSRNETIGVRQLRIESEPIAEGRYLYGHELPLSQVEPGDYTLYAVVSDGEGRAEIRRADFHVVP